jgi:hypothetical protein
VGVDVVVKDYEHPAHLVLCGITGGLEIGLLFIVILNHTLGFLRFSPEGIKGARRHAQLRLNILLKFRGGLCFHRQQAQNRVRTILG